MQARCHFCDSRDMDGAGGADGRSSKLSRSESGSFFLRKPCSQDSCNPTVLLGITENALQRQYNFSREEAVECARVAATCLSYGEPITVSYAMMYYNKQFESKYIMGVNVHGTLQLAMTCDCITQDYDQAIAMVEALHKYGLAALLEIKCAEDGEPTHVMAAYRVDTSRRGSATIVASDPHHYYSGKKSLDVWVSRDEFWRLYCIKNQVYRTRLDSTGKKLEGAQIVPAIFADTCPSTLPNVDWKLWFYVVKETHPTGTLSFVLVDGVLQTVYHEEALIQRNTLCPNQGCKHSFEDPRTGKIPPCSIHEIMRVNKLAAKLFVERMNARGKRGYMTRHEIRHTLDFCTQVIIEEEERASGNGICCDSASQPEKEPAQGGAASSDPL